MVNSSPRTNQKVWSNICFHFKPFYNSQRSDCVDELLQPHQASCTTDAERPRQNTWVQLYQFHVVVTSWNYASTCKMAANTAGVAETSGPEEDQVVVAPQDTNEGIVAEGSTVILTKDRIILPCRMERGRYGLQKMCLISTLMTIDVYV